MWGPPGRTGDLDGSSSNRRTGTLSDPRTTGVGSTGWICDRLTIGGEDRTTSRLESFQSTNNYDFVLTTPSTGLSTSVWGGPGGRSRLGSSVELGKSWKLLARSRVTRHVRRQRNQNRCPSLVLGSSTYVLSGIPSIPQVGSVGLRQRNPYTYMKRLSSQSLSDPTTWNHVKDRKEVR